MKIAVEGCCHGELDKIYETISYLEKRENVKVDLLICCGDFQAVRNEADMVCMAVPQKYQTMQTFWKYYAGLKTAPILTIFVGGNHEASNHLQELPYGGWVAPNIYYLGYAGVVRFGGVRIAGLSGIFKGPDYNKGHFEHPPYSKDTIRSAYHLRNIDVFRMKQISRPLDIMITHDWPRGIYNYGDADRLVRFKKHFKDEIEANVLGNPMTEILLEMIKPDYWFSAHLHCKFVAVVDHKTTPPRTTKFMALDKCLPKRDFLQLVDIPHQGELKLELDPEWLVVLKSTNHLMSTSKGTTYMPGPGCNERWDFTATDEEIKGIREIFDNDLTIPENFERTVPVYDPAHHDKHAKPPPTMVNPQTELLCTMLDILDPNTKFLGIKNSSLLEEEISLDDSRLNDTTGIYSDIDVSMNSSTNPEEISLDDDDDDDVIDEDDDDVIIESEHVSGDEDSASSTEVKRKLILPDIKLENPDIGRLSLPNPKLTSTPTRQENADPVPRMGLPPPLRLDSSLSSTESSMDESMSESSERPIKKFKRRNQSLYSD